MFKKNTYCPKAEISIFWDLTENKIDDSFLKNVSQDLSKDLKYVKDNILMDGDDCEYHFNFLEFFNPNVLFSLYASGIKGSLEANFSKDPSEFVVDGEGSLEKNVHLEIQIDDNEIFVNLSRERYYDFDYIEDDEILLKAKEIKENDKDLNYSWEEFKYSFESIDDNSLKDFSDKFINHFDNEIFFK